jgi:hypothetical protein
MLCAGVQKRLFPSSESSQCSGEKQACKVVMAPVAKRVQISILLTPPLQVDEERATGQERGD